MTVNDHRKIMFQNYYELVDFTKELLFIANSDFTKEVLLIVNSSFLLKMQRKKDLVVLYEAIPDPQSLLQRSIFSQRSPYKEKGIGNQVVP